MMQFLVLGVFILGAILLLILVLRELYYEAAKGKKALDEEEGPLIPRISYYHDNPSDEKEEETSVPCASPQCIQNLDISRLQLQQASATGIIHISKTKIMCSETTPKNGFYAGDEFDLGGVQKDSDSD
ncbi:unnamed protein product [Thlaspi arvense]|uniref:Uncharacterized protein n=1 Tax=Thlaspi arvense TaxID=13288 RepID=A0AAU9SUD9_THLAR|nr:unnamed protein product [Thlaspi arvense]